MSKITIDRSVVEQALEALNASMPHNNDMDGDWPSHIAARRALRAALEQPVEQEPVAWANINKRGDITHTSNKKMAWAKTPLYLHPQPPRQPLTLDQILDAIRPAWSDPTCTLEHVVRAIEEAIWKKNS